MFTLRCTQRLLARLGPPAAEPAQATTTLGDWYANALNVGRRRLVLCTSERTLLSVLVPAKELRSLPERLREAVAHLLTRLEIPSDAIAREHDAMHAHQFGRTASRQILGSMNDFAFLAEPYLRDDGPDADLETIALALNRAPCRPIGYESPDRCTQAMFRRAS